MLNIIVVSPSSASRLLVGEALKNRGYQLICVASWRDLHHMAVKVEKQSLYILDHSLGDERVVPIIQEIRRRATQYRIPIMVISASPRSEDVMRLFKQDIDDYYLKPLQEEALCQRVKRLLSLFPVPSEPQYPDTIQLDMNRLINFEIARARRGNYPFSIIQLSLDADEASRNSQYDPQEMMNLCYDALRPLFRETDILIGAENRLVVLCPFSDQSGTRVIMRKMIETLNQHRGDYPFGILEMSYATYPYDGRDKGGLLTYASANKESLQEMVR